MLVKEVIDSTNGTTTIVKYHWGNDHSGTRDGAAGIGGVGRSPTFKNQIFSDPFEAQLRGALGAAVTEPCFQAVGVDSRLRSKGGGRFQK